MTTLISLIYDAVLDPRRWSEFLGVLATQLGGASIGMSLRHPRLGDPGWIVFHDTDPAYDAAYQERYFGIDPFRTRSAALAPGSCEMMAGGVIDASTLARSEFYNEWMRPHGWLPSPSLGVTLDRDRHGEPIGLGIFRPRGARAYGDRELRLLRTLVPSLQQATRLALRLADSDAQLAATCDALEMLPVAAVLVDPAGNAVRTNQKAHALAEIGDAARSRHGRLVLHPSIALALRAPRHGAGRRGTAARRRGRGPARCRSRAAPAARGALLGAAGDRRGRPPRLLLGADRGSRARLPAVGRRARGGARPHRRRGAPLRPARGGPQARRGGGGAAGRAREVRSQLKSAFRKTRARSQADLVRLVLQRPMLARADG